MAWHDRWTLYVDSKVLGGTFCIHELEVLTTDQLTLLKAECDGWLDEWRGRKWNRKVTTEYFSTELERLIKLRHEHP